MKVEHKTYLMYLTLFLLSIFMVTLFFRNESTGGTFFWSLIGGFCLRGMIKHHHSFWKVND